MATQLDSWLAALDTPAHRPLLTRLRRGIEKESLRVQPSGALSREPHPSALGSTLTHPNITTDFSEAQLELITGVHNAIPDCIDELADVHQFVYRHIGDELLWPASMPCILGADEDIPVGRYGSSNIGRAKTIYRIGLGWRYGRLMQTISGIHYNFSLPDDMWPVLAAAAGKKSDQQFRTDAYFGLIRNFRRSAWLLNLLLGASPSLCKSFVKGKQHALETFDEGSLYLPYATSLRMGRLGYQSDAQSSLHVSYNSLAEYAGSMRYALTNSYPAYEKIGVRVDGEYRQLNDTLLQIENEFYGSIRPKRRIHSGERAIAALFERGVEYVEVRCLDLNPFLPLGIDAETMRFLDIFLCYCLFSISPDDSPAETTEVAENQLTVVERGREPGLRLRRQGQDVAMADWAREVLDGCEEIAALLDRAAGGTDYQQALSLQRQRLDDLSLTPSAAILDAMRSEELPFARLVLREAQRHKEALLSRPMSAQRAAELEELARRSLQAQQEVEAADTLDFKTFLARYLELPDFRQAS